MRNIHSFVVALVLGAATQAVAQEKQLDDAQPPASEASAEAVNEPVKEAATDAKVEPAAVKVEGGYGAAGCGLGTLLFDPSNDFTQVFAGTTNGTFGTQTFGISSGTSNCDGAGYQPGSTTAFIQTNRSALAKDIARGRGATIAGLSDLAGCNDSRAVGRTLQRNFKNIFPSAATDDKAVSSSVLRVLKSDQALSCTHLA